MAPEEGTRVRGGPPSGKWHRGRLRSDAEKQLASDPEGARKVPQRALERSAEREP